MATGTRMLELHVDLDDTEFRCDYQLDGTTDEQSVAVLLAFKALGKAAGDLIAATEAKHK